MIPYGCLATGQNVGMIEVVRNAKTVMHILKQDIRSAMMVRTKELHSWIKEKNRSPSSAVDRTAGSSERYMPLNHFLIITRCKWPVQTRHRYFSSLKELFEVVDAHFVLDFIKAIGFCNCI